MNINIIKQAINRQLQVVFAICQQYLWKTSTLINTIIVLAFILTGCSSAKYSTEFKAQKKNIDTLTIIKPIVTIDARNNKVQFLSTELINSVQQTIEGLTIDILSSKYVLKEEKLSNIDTTIFNKIYDQIENSPKRISGVSSDSILKQIAPNIKSRFALLITYDGKINPNYEPHNNLMAGLASGYVIIAPNTKPHSDLRLMIIDTEIHEVVYFDRVKTSNYDPRVKSEIERIIKTILRNIYYK
ncbi:MAG: hypothetical protein DRJ05_06005 [Bacteroidetes bacterium]|nr:MAG: hypothetical protein DRJ05_06005 [Bacteroidota bacterium]